MVRGFEEAGPSAFVAEWLDFAFGHTYSVKCKEEQERAGGTQHQCWLDGAQQLNKSQFLSNQDDTAVHKEEEKSTIKSGASNALMGPFFPGRSLIVRVKTRQCLLIQPVSSQPVSTLFLHDQACVADSPHQCSNRDGRRSNKWESSL